MKPAAGSDGVGARGAKGGTAAGSGAGAEAAAARPLFVAHAALAPDPNQPRQGGIADGLEKLVESIRAHGIIQPILARPHPDAAARGATPYMIVTGERRWTAAGLAGRDEVPVFLLAEALSDADLLMLQIEENDGDNRQGLSLYDLARGVARAYELDGRSQAKFALSHRKSASWVSSLLSLARADGLTAEALRERRLRGIVAAYTFQRLSPEQQRELLARARRQGGAITVDAAEKLAGRPGRAGRSRERSERGEGEVWVDPMAGDRGNGGDRRATSASLPSSVAGDRSARSSQSEGGAFGGDDGSDDLYALDEAEPATAAAAPRSAAEGLLAAGLLGKSPRVARSETPARLSQPAAPPSTRGAERPVESTAADLFTVQFSLTQLHTLLRRFGQEPAANPDALVRQLFTCL
jgi:ParB family chromosome partitioning protein